MEQEDLMNAIKNAQELSKSLNIPFKNIGYPESYPNDQKDEYTSANFDTHMNLKHHTDSLAGLYEITQNYRSYETENGILKHIFPKLRKYLFRELDFRYGLIFRKQEEFNIHTAEALRILKKTVMELEKQLTEKDTELNKLKNPTLNQSK